MGAGGRERSELSNNSLTGTVPVLQPADSAIKYVWLDHNELTGTLPPELFQFSRLVEL